MVETKEQRKSVDAFAPIHTQTWENGRHLVRCVRVIDETWDVRTFCFAATVPVMFFFKPGQFVTLELEIGGQTVMRSYTISSSPSVPYSFSITVKRVDGGVVSNWLHDNLAEGGELAVHGPVGLFNCIDYPTDKVLLLSGGVGVTPLMSMARWFFDTNADVDIVFVHSARAPGDIIYRRELEGMAARINNFSLHLVCERYANGEIWSGYRGFLDQAKLELMAPDFMSREIFCCGPEPYMRAVKKILCDNGFDMSRYHEESFAATPIEDEKFAEEQAVVASEELKLIHQSDMTEVVFSAAGRSVSIAPGETVHTAAVKLGLHIPKACGMGICGTCKVLKAEGEVEMAHNGGILDDDIEAGYILSCCSVPRGRVVIDL